MRHARDARFHSVDQRFHVEVNFYRFISSFRQLVAGRCSFVGVLPYDLGNVVLGAPVVRGWSLPGTAIMPITATHESGDFVDDRDVRIVSASTHSLRSLTVTMATRVDVRQDGDVRVSFQGKVVRVVFKRLVFQVFFRGFVTKGRRHAHDGRRAGLFRVFFRLLVLHWGLVLGPGM